MKEKKRRSNEDIEKNITDAATSLIKKKGISGLLVTDIIKDAKIEPVVFYKRYENLLDFINHFVKKYDYWFSDVIQKSKASECDKKLYNNIMANLLRSLKSNIVMQQILKWELATDNDIARRTAQLREFHTLPIAKEYEKKFEQSSIDIVAISSLIVGGIYYLVLHSHLSTFSGIDINSENGEKRIFNALNYLTELLFEEKSENTKIINIAIKMKKNNIDIETISSCTELPIDIIKIL